eukprot:GHVU01061101.1.p1 GENE.GHVU01061101.1~~GHVU01061101.1.p1  ORF type:complete len:151 (-),score=7.73 GHVU01061101.1:120-572(-)
MNESIAMHAYRHYAAKGAAGMQAAKERNVCRCIYVCDDRLYVHSTVSIHPNRTYKKQRSGGTVNNSNGRVCVCVCVCVRVCVCVCVVCVYNQMLNLTYLPTSLSLSKSLYLYPPIPLSGGGERREEKKHLKKMSRAGQCFSSPPHPHQRW